MANFDVTNPVYNEKLRKLEKTDPASADVFNQLYGYLINNDVFLKHIVDALAKETAEHMADGRIHVTQENKQAWDAKADKTAVTEEIRRIEVEVEDTKKSVRDGKAMVAAAITQKKVSTSATATFSEITSNIDKIPLGSGDAVENQVLSGVTFSNKTGLTLTGTMPNQGAKAQSLNAGGSYTIPAGYHNGNGKVTANSLASQTSATAIAGQILNGQTAWVNGTKLTGTIPSKPAQTYIPSTTNQIIPSGQYLSGTQTIQGSANLIAENIRNGITLFGVTGILGGLNFKGLINLSEPKYRLTGGTIGDYAVFAGGISHKSVDAYDRQLTHVEIPSLSISKNAPACANVGNYLLVAGGNGTKTVECYDNELTKTMASELTWGKQLLAGGSIGNYAVFGGGYASSDFRSDVEAYDKQLIKTIIAPLSEKRNALACATCGNKKYLLFVGGYTTGKASNKIDIYDKNLVHISTLEISENTHMLAGASMGKYAVFAGGSPASIALAFDESLIEIKLEKLSQSRSELAGVGLGEELVIFAGGYNGSKACNNIDIYDSHLCRTTPNRTISTSRRSLSAVTLGNSVLVAGGYSTDSFSCIDIFEKII